MRRDSFDIVFGDDVRQRIELATNVAMTFGQNQISERVSSMPR
jgi:hypothetical protein